MDINKIREDFPILNQLIYKKPLIYFDNAATTQKPIQVIDVISNYYKEYNSNVHRGVHYLSQKATNEMERGREVVKDFLNASSLQEIIFTRGTTEAINLVAHSFSKQFLKSGDEIIISTLEHHSNIVPWQMACEEFGATLRVIPIAEDGSLLMDEFEKLITSRTKIISITHISNALGVINPIKEIIKIAHAHNIPVMVDGAQSSQHLKIDVQDLDCDFFCFSGHKLYGPTGIGILYGKEKWLNAMPPYQGGGEMIAQVTFEKTTYNELPFKFEAGTPDISGIIGLTRAIEYVTAIGLNQIANYEADLLNYATQRISQIPNVKIYGTAPTKASVLSFLIGNIHPLDLGTLLDKMGIAIRTGHHCAQPLMNRFNIPGTLRASFAIYNTKEEIDSFIEAIERASLLLL